jgi:hypothetical protein
MIRVNKDIVSIPNLIETSTIIDSTRGNIDWIIQSLFYQGSHYRLSVTNQIVSDSYTITDTLITPDYQLTFDTNKSSVQKSILLVDSINQTKNVYSSVAYNNNVILHHGVGSDTKYLLVKGTQKFNSDMQIDQRTGQFYSILHLDASGTIRSFMDQSYNVLSSDDLIVYGYDFNLQKENFQKISQKTYYHHTIDASGRLNLITKDNSQFNFYILDSSGVNQIYNVFNKTEYSINSIPLNDLKVFLIFPDTRLVVGLSKITLSTTKFYLGVDDLFTSEYIAGGSFEEILFIQIQALNHYYIFVKNSANRIKLVARDPSGNFNYNTFSNRDVIFKNHFIRENVYYVVGLEGTKTILFIFMMGDLLFEYEVGDENISFGMTDYYYKDKFISPTKLNYLFIYHELIGIYRADINRVQISGNVPNYFVDINFPQRNVYFDKITQQITNDRTKQWIGLRDYNNNLYLKF